MESAVLLPRSVLEALVTACGDSNLQQEVRQKYLKDQDTTVDREYRPESILSFAHSVEHLKVGS